MSKLTAILDRMDAAAAEPTGLAAILDRLDAQPEQGLAEPSYLEVAKKGVARGVESMAGSVGSMGEWASEVVGADGAAKVFRTAREYWDDAQSEGWAKPDERIFGGGDFFDNPSLKRAVGRIAEAAPWLAGSMAVGGAGMGAARIAGMTGARAATMGGATAGAILGTAEGSQDYVGAREAGKSVGEASAIGAASSAGTAVLEALPTGVFLRGLKGGVGKRAIKGVIGEGVTESMQTYWQNLVRKIGYDKTQVLAEGLVDSFIGGAGVGGVAGAVFSREDADVVVKGANEKINEAREAGATDDDIAVARDDLAEQFSRDAESIATQMAQVDQEDRGKREFAPMAPSGVQEAPQAPTEGVSTPEAPKPVETPVDAEKAAKDAGVEFKGYMNEIYMFQDDQTGSVSVEALADLPVELKKKRAAFAPKSGADIVQFPSKQAEPELPMPDTGIPEGVLEAREAAERVYPTVKESRNESIPGSVVMNVVTMAGGERSTNLHAPYDGTARDALRVAKGLKLYAAENYDASMRSSPVFATDKNGAKAFNYTQGAGITAVKPELKVTNPKPAQQQPKGDRAAEALPSRPESTPEVVSKAKGVEPWEVGRDEGFVSFIDSTQNTKELNALADRGVTSGPEWKKAYRSLKDKYVEQYRRGGVKEFWEKPFSYWMKNEAAFDVAKAIQGVRSSNDIYSQESARWLETGVGELYPDAPRNLHKADVRRAIKEGKPVPPEVLKDYPDLAKSAEGTDATKQAPKAKGEVPPVAQAAKAVEEAAAGGVKLSKADPAGMTAGKINKELDALEKRSSKNIDALIAAGRGHELTSETLKGSDPLSQEAKAISERTGALRNEISRRYGPNAPSRLPSRGFGPIKEHHTTKKGNGTVTLADIQDAFAGSKVGYVSPTKSGKAYIVTPAGVQFTVNTVKQIAPNTLRFSAEYGREMVRNEKIVGKSKGAEILLTKEADVWTLRHEQYHSLETLGIVTPAERTVLRKRIQTLTWDKKFKPIDRHNVGGAEDRARFVEAELKARSHKGPVAKIVQKIGDFIDSLVNLFTRTHRGILRDVESGAVLKRESLSQGASGDIEAFMTKISNESFRHVDTESSEFRAWSDNLPITSLLTGSSKIKGGGVFLAVHGTFGDFEAFEETKGAHLGFHFGTPDAATDRMDTIGEERGGDKLDLSSNRRLVDDLLKSRDKIWQSGRERFNKNNPDHTDKILAALDSEDKGALSRVLENNEDYTEAEELRLNEIDDAIGRLGIPTEALRNSARVGAKYIPVYVKIKKPLRSRDAGNWGDAEKVAEATGFDGDTVDEIRGAIESAGYDGIVYQNAVEDSILENDSIIAFHDTQIKSAISNTGDFSDTDARIHYSTKTFGDTKGPVTDSDLDSVAEIKRDSKAAAKRHAKNLTDEIKRVADEYLGSISTRLGNVNEKLKYALRRHEWGMNKAHATDAKEFLVFMRKANKMNRSDYTKFGYALANSHMPFVNEMLEKYGMEKDYAKVVSVISDMEANAKDVGLSFGRIENYWPRILKDSKGFLTAIGKEPSWGFYTQKLKEKADKLGIAVSDLSDDQKADFIANLILGGHHGLVGPTATKARKLQKIPAELYQYYMDPMAALMAHSYSMRKAIAARRFFGKTPERVSKMKRLLNGATTAIRDANKVLADNNASEADKAKAQKRKNEQYGIQKTCEAYIEKYSEQRNFRENVGAYVLELIATGEISREDEKVVQDILNARFHEKGTDGIFQAYKNLSYIDTMGSVVSALTQIGDLAWSGYEAGVTKTLKNAYKAARGDSRITKEDLGITIQAQEFADASTLGRAVSWVFKATGLEKIDSIGKETLVNSAHEKYMEDAKKDQAALRRKLEPIFPDNVDDVIGDLLDNKVTPEVEFLLYSRLLDFQPVAMSEMSQKYLTAGNGRLMYMLKTFTLKQFDAFRNEAYNKIKNGNKAEKIQGMQNLVRLGMFFVLANAGADELKDLVLGRETTLEDRVADNMLRLFGVSKFVTWKARTDGVGSALSRQILPPFKFIDSAGKDIMSAGDDKGLQTLGSVPLVGKLAYWHMGRGTHNRDDLWTRRFSKAKSKLRKVHDNLEKAKDKAAYREGNREELVGYRRINKVQGSLNKLRKRINHLKSLPTSKDREETIERLTERRVQIIKSYLGRK